LTYIQNLWTNTELTLGAIFGICFTCLDKAVGGIDASIEALAVLMIVDVLTGIAAGLKHHRLSSAIGARGLFKKAGIFLCILIGFLLDTAMNADIFRDMVIAGFALIECMSLIENIDRMGFGYIIPAFLRTKLKQIADEKDINKKKGDNKK
jgi:toxin secretion/phage lysis holin